jgi:hypothetical protein
MPRTLQVAAIALALMGALVPADGRAVDLDAKDWSARIDRTLPPPDSLHVTGTVTVANPGVLVRLQPAAVQGPDPTILVLDLETEQQPGFWAQVLVEREVRYDVEAYTAKPHSKVTIRSEGAEITMEVKDAR